MTDTTIDLETINIHLIGNEKEIAAGIRLIDAQFRPRIYAVIRSKAFSANPDDVFDIYQLVLLGINQSARAGDYDPDATALEGFMYRIAANKAVDWLRKKTAIKRGGNVDQDVLIDSVSEAIKDSNIYEAWHEAHRNEERGTILETIRSLVPNLKLRQRQVAEIIIGAFTASLDNSEIKERILQVYGEDVSTSAVKSAKTKVLEKVQLSLKRRGYGELIDG